MVILIILIILIHSWINKQLINQVYTFTGGGNVGIGRLVTVSGGGAIQALLSSFLTVPNWQLHSNNGSVSLLISLHLAKGGHLILTQGEGHSCLFHELQGFVSSMYWNCKYCLVV